MTFSCPKAMRSTRIIDMTPGLESLARLAILMATLTVILWTNASDFDATEIKALSLFFLGAAGLEGGTSFLKSLRGRE